MRKFIQYFMGVFSADETPDDIFYEPAHVALLLLSVGAALGILYWLLWALLVFEGGLFGKIAPFLQAILTPKTLADFGYRGHPHALGVFAGWIVNAAALILSLGLLAALYRLFHTGDRHDPR